MFILIYFIYFTLPYITFFTLFTLLTLFTLFTLLYITFFTLLTLFTLIYLTLPYITFFTLLCLLYLLSLLYITLHYITFFTYFIYFTLRYFTLFTLRVEGSKCPHVLGHQSLHPVGLLDSLFVYICSPTDRTLHRRSSWMWWPRQHCPALTQLLSKWNECRMRLEGTWALIWIGSLYTI